MTNKATWAGPLLPRTGFCVRGGFYKDYRQQNGHFSSKSKQIHSGEEFLSLKWSHRKCSQASQPSQCILFIKGETRPAKVRCLLKNRERLHGFWGDIWNNPQLKSPFPTAVKMCITLGQEQLLATWNCCLAAPWLGCMPAVEGSASRPHLCPPALQHSVSFRISVATQTSNSSFHGTNPQGNTARACLFLQDKLLLLDSQKSQAYCSKS